MQRDMELVRAILKSVQSRQALDYALVRIPDQPVWLVQRHAELLVEAGFLEGQCSPDPDEGFPLVMIRDLTWQGHDFVAALDNESVWAKIKQTLSPLELATLPLGLVKTVGLKMLEGYVMQKMGLTGG